MASVSDSMPLGTTIDNTLGAILVGFAISCVVYGVLTTQIYTYFSRYPSDKAVYKFLVLLVLHVLFYHKSLVDLFSRVLETAHQVIIGHIVYFYGVKSFADPTAIIEATVTWYVLAIPVFLRPLSICIRSFIVRYRFTFVSMLSLHQMQQTIGSIVGVIVKTYFAMRVWRCELCYIPSFYLPFVVSQRNYYVTSLIVSFLYLPYSRHSFLTRNFQLLLTWGQLGLAIAFT